MAILMLAAGGCLGQATPLSRADLAAIPDVAREFRAAWIATVANIDWPSRPGLPVEQQKSELIAMLDKAAEIRLNAVVLQVRPACDALYASKLEPWSEFLTGTMGKAPEPYYDPLEFAVTEAHKRGLELHAWFNPYRARHPQGKSEISADHISKTHPDLVKTYGTYLWLDPGEKAVQDHTVAVMLDVARRYDVDGIHIDDYFYPYRVKGPDGNILDFPDDPSWKKYTDAGGTLNRDDWRRENVNVLVQRFYSELKQLKPHVKFGISPFGIGRPGMPPGITGFDQYTELYADTLKWLRNGWMDYWTPQLYWKIESKGQSFPVLLKFWAGENAKQRHLWPGLYTSQVGSGGNSWAADEIVNQVRTIRQQQGATGEVHFSFKAFMRDKALCDALTKELYAKPAVPPASPWLDAVAPARPELTVRKNPDGPGIAASWKPGDSEEPWLWAVFTRCGGEWSCQVLPGTEREIVYEPGEAADADCCIAVAALDKSANESERAGFCIEAK